MGANWSLKTEMTNQTWGKCSTFLIINVFRALTALTKTHKTQLRIHLILFYPLATDHNLSQSLLTYFQFFLLLCLIEQKRPLCLHVTRACVWACVCVCECLSDFILVQRKTDSLHYSFPIKSSCTDLICQHMQALISAGVCEDSKFFTAFCMPSGKSRKMLLVFLKKNYVGTMQSSFYTP